MSVTAAIPMTSSFARIEALRDYVGRVASVRGWVTHLRSSGKVAFVVLRDGTGIVQVVIVKNNVPAEVWERFQQLTVETSVGVTGEVREDARSPGGLEMSATELEIIGPSPTDYPIQPKEHGVDFLLDHRHLWLRSRAPAGDRARAQRGRAGDPRFLLRARLSSRRHADPHGRDRRARRVCSRRSTSTRGQPTSRRPASCTAKRPRRRSGRSTRSVRRSAPRSRRRGGTSPSSG